MIARGSMVVLKGHHLFPMVVAQADEIVTVEMPGFIDTDREPAAQVIWLDTFGVPHRGTYPLYLLEEIDG